MRRSILRSVVMIIFRIHSIGSIFEANVSVGVMTILNKRSLCRSRYDLDVNSCLSLVNDAQAALIRLLISVVSCCSKVIVCPRYFARSFTGRTSILMLSIVTSFLLFDPSLLNCRLLLVDFQSHAFCTFFLKSHIILLSCSKDVENNK